MPRTSPSGRPTIDIRAFSGRVTAALRAHVPDGATERLARLRARVAPSLGSGRRTLAGPVAALALSLTGTGAGAVLALSLVAGASVPPSVTEASALRPWPNSDRYTVAASASGGDALEARGPSLVAATVSDGHFGGLDAAIALAAAGYEVGESLTEDTVRTAAETFGVTVSDPVTRGEVAIVTRLAWRAARTQWILAGIGPGEGPDPTDIVEASQRLGVSIGRTLEPSDVTAVLRQGRGIVTRVVKSAGIDVGQRLDVSDLEVTARSIGLDYGRTFNAVDTKALVFTIGDPVERAWEAENLTPVFAEARGVKLRLPSHRVSYAGFHQASYGAAIPMNGRSDAKVDVLPSRRRGTSRTSAIDIVMAPGEDVRAPVTGRVVEVTNYALYGRYADVRVRIVPSDNPGTVVSMLHMVGPTVAVGSWVEGGKTKIADGPRKFPFSSQVDAISGRAWGHVHIELRSR